MAKTKRVRRKSIASYSAVGGEGAIRVYIRMRPLLPRETEYKEVQITRGADSDVIQVKYLKIKLLFRFYSRCIGD